MWYNVTFAVIPTTDAKIDITNFNNTTNPADKQPDLIIVGGGIANADDPKAAAKKCRDIINEND